MTWQYTPYGLPLLLAAVISLLLAFLAWRRRPAPGAAPFALMLLALTVWLLGYALQLASVELNPRLRWLRLQYVGATLVPLLWVLFILEYTGRRKWITVRNVALMAFPVAVILALVWAHPTLGLDMDIKYPPDSQKYFEQMIDYLFGQPYWWASLFYSYLYLLAGTLMLVGAMVRSRHLYRGQMTALLVGAMIPWGAHVVMLAGLNPRPDLELTPFAFTLTGVVLIWGVFRYQLLDVVPTARYEVVEHMSDGVIVLDAQNRVIDFNPAAEHILKLGPDVLGQPAKEIFQNTPLENYTEDVTQRDEEITLYKEHCFELHISPLYRRRSISGKLFILHEITEHKRAEAERESLIEELDAFAHTVAHDLKNPLSLITSFSQLLRTRYEDLSEDKRGKFLMRVEQSAHKMDNIIDELYLLASVRKQEDIHTQPLEMAPIVTEAIQRLDLLVEEYEAHIALPDMASWPAVWGYGPWVEEVWVNYLSNAIKYGSTDSAPPYVEIGADVQENGTARFWVRDHGPGLTQAQCTQLFRPFTRLNQIKAQGQGLGLSIVQRIVTRLGGEVAVESQIDAGSMFSFTLPLAD